MSGAVEQSEDGRATRWVGHKEQRRNHIIDAALQAIEQSGPDVGVQQIAERAELPRPVVYRHFKDRDDLDRQIMQRAVDNLLDELRPTLRPTGTGLESVDRVVRTYVRWIDEQPNLHRFIGARSKPQRPSHSGVVAGTRNEIAAHVARVCTEMLEPLGVRADIADPMAFGLVGLVDSAVNRWLSTPGSQLDATLLAERLTASVWGVIDATLRAEGVTLDPNEPLLPAEDDDAQG